MSYTRKFYQEEGLLIFDPELDNRCSTYDAKHLDVLENTEESHFWFKNRRHKICNIFEAYVPKSSRILEIGGGTGFIAAKLQKLGFSIEMADIHSNGLRQAKKKGISKLYQFDLFNPPFQQAFEVICLFDVLEHLSDPIKAIECLKKMLKPKGIIILTVPAHQWLWSRDDVVARHHQRFTKTTLLKLFQQTHLTPLYMRYFFSAILPFLLMRRIIRRDDKLPLRKDELFKTEIPLICNYFFDLLTRLEFHIEKFLPNIAGGSLLAVANI